MKKKKTCGSVQGRGLLLYWPGCEHDVSESSLGGSLYKRGSSAKSRVG
jgi:hypothetical protein